MKRLHKVQLQRDFSLLPGFWKARRRKKLFSMQAAAAARESIRLRVYVTLSSSRGTGGIEQERGRARSRRRAGRGDAIHRKKGLVNLLHSQGVRRRHASAGRGLSSTVLVRDPWLWNAAARFLAMDGKRVLAQPMRSRIRKHATVYVRLSDSVPANRLTVQAGVPQKAVCQLSGRAPGLLLTLPSSVERCDQLVFTVFARPCLCYSAVHDQACVSLLFFTSEP